jgi:triosephosphate isomerase
MRRSLVAGNWKMNGSREMAAALAGAVAGAVAGAAPSTLDVAVCPPFPYLLPVRDVLGESVVALGAQDVSEHAAGAYTGEVSAGMLSDAGCSVVLVGHSERRHGLGESDARVAAKFVAAAEAGLVPVLCVGETLEEREAGRTRAVVLAQLDAVFRALEGRGGPARDFVVAYEPVWAIGTGRTASPEQAQEVHALLRARLAEAGAPAGRIRILYGGSVKADNASALFAMEDIDGGLIGGASLQAEPFLDICRAAGD